MGLPRGTRLGPYEIVEPLGSGGMGVVYRARDARLERDVAVKIIAAEREPTEEQRRRFEREARSASGLTHPNICSVYDVGHEAGVDFLVTELLDGETLEARLSRGPLSIEQCIDTGALIASALAAAHERGIVHRDLKPANVMLTATGPKLLDFGLAKAFDPPVVEVDSDTAAKITGTGIVLGTLPYMAPEQLEGKPADARSDLFALGAVLYEMVTGRRAFVADDRARLIGALLTSDPPPVSAARPGAPPALDRLIRICLAKDPGERWHCAHDIELQLRTLPVGREEPTGIPARKRRGWLPWALAGAVAVAAVVWRWSPGDRAPRAPVQFTVRPPEGGGVLWTSEANPLALSPDGRQLAFVASDSAGRVEIWLRPLASAVATPVPGTIGATSLMWSPDGRSLAFFTSDRLQRLELPDGAPMTITPIASRSGQSGSWGRRGDILFAGVQGDAIYRVPASGGPPEVTVRPDSTLGETRVHSPWHLPDGERFLYVVREADGRGRLIEAMPDGRRVTVMEIESLVQYADPDLLVFVRDGTLLGQRFDPNGARALGDPFAIADDVRYFLSTGVAAAATSIGGTLAFQQGHDVQRLVWLDRQGRDLGTAGSDAYYLHFALSADAGRLLASRQQPTLGTWDLWLQDFGRATETALTTSRDTEVYGLWLPGERSFVYALGAGGPPNVVRRDLGSTTYTRLSQDPAFQIPSAVSPDGSTLLFRRREAGGSFDIWTMPTTPGERSTPWLETPFSESDAMFGPDGRYVAFISDETGTPELYVAPLEDPLARTRVSREGARLARWLRGSREIVYVTPEGRVMAAPVTTRPGLRIGPPTELFTTDPGAPWTTFDASADGSRFLVAIPIAVANRGPITVIANWAAAAPR